MSAFGNSLALKFRLGLLPRRATAPLCALSSAAGRTLGLSESISRPRLGSSQWRAQHDSNVRPPGPQPDRSGT